MLEVKTCVGGKERAGRFVCSVGVCVCLATICVCVLKFHTSGGGEGGERPAQGAGGLLVAKWVRMCALQQVCEHK